MNSPIITDVLKDYPRDLCGCNACRKDYEQRNLIILQPIMVTCPECGNKRCPKASNHNNECTNSNEPGQKGSDYE